MSFDRLSISEVSFSRLYEAAKRRMLDTPHFLAWYIDNPLSGINAERLSRFKKRHAGQRCFILGNGPSLSRMDLSPLKNEITFGLNRIYLLFDQMHFQPTYYTAVNELVLGQFSSEIQSLAMPKFLNWNLRSRFDVHDENINFVRLNLSVTDGFAQDITRPLYSGGTITYVALQIAYTMGFSEVILIGVDHSFADKGIPNKVETRQSDADLNHFHPDYFPKGVKWQLPDLKRSEVAYALARKAFEQDGRKVLDATLDGKCTVFEKVDFKSLF